MWGIFTFNGNICPRHTEYNCLTGPAVPMSFTDAIFITGSSSGNWAQCFIHILCETKNAELEGSCVGFLMRAL